MIAQAGMGAAFAGHLLRAPARSRRPDPRAIRSLAKIGGELFVRTAALTGSFAVASAGLSGTFVSAWRMQVSSVWR